MKKNVLIQNSLRIALLGLVLALSAPGMAIADNPSIHVQQNWNISASSLGPALDQLAAQAGLKLTYPPSLVAGKTSSGIKGEHSAEQALNALLAGSGIEARVADDGTVALAKVAEQAGVQQLDTIIVVGEKIGRPLRETPASTVVLGREVDTPENRRLQDVINAIPNVLTDSASSNLPSVRGVDGSSNLHVNSSFMTGGQPRVNTLVDGVARPFKLSSISSLSSAWDIESVEMARGPQSTISGRNSFGGAIRVSTRDPIHELEFAARTGYFNEPGTVEGALMVNLPLVEDQVALRITAEGSDGESYVDITGFDPDYVPTADHDKLDDEKFERYRGKLLLTPNALPDTDLLLSIDHTETWRAHQPKADDAHADDLINSSWNIGNWIEDNEQTVYSAELFQGLGETTELEVRVSYLDNTAKMPPGILSFFDLTYETETTSAEALLRFGKLGFINKGVVGLAYEEQEDEGINDPPNNAPFDFTMDGEAETYGLFGEIEVGLGSGFTAIAGGRFQTDERRRDVTTETLGNPRSQNALKVSDDAFIPKLGIRYDGAEKYVAGYTYSEGYRAGGIDFHIFSVPLPATTFDSERMKNHEIWVRSNPTDRLSLNASLFYYTMEDMQIRGATSAGPCAGSVFISPCLTGNIPEAKGYGMELEAQFDINDAWRISGGLGLLETEITDAGSDVPQYQGQELNQAPDVNANLGISWVSQFGLDAEVRVRYVGSFRNHLDAEFGSSDDIGDYTLVDFKTGYETKLGGIGWRIDVFVENLTDEGYVLMGSAHSGPKDAAGRPRTLGFFVTVRF